MHRYATATSRPSDWLAPSAFHFDSREHIDQLDRLEPDAGPAATTCHHDHNHGRCILAHQRDCTWWLDACRYPGGIEDPQRWCVDPRSLLSSIDLPWFCLNSTDLGSPKNPHRARQPRLHPPRVERHACAEGPDAASLNRGGTLNHTQGPQGDGNNLYQGWGSNGPFAAASTSWLKENSQYVRGTGFSSAAGHYTQVGPVARVSRLDSGPGASAGY